MSLKPPTPPVQDGVKLERASRRIKVFEPTTIKYGGNGHQRAHLIDISTSGALMHSHPSPRKDDIASIAFGHLHIDATVVWVEGDRFGVRFQHHLSSDHLERLLC